MHPIDVDNFIKLLKK